MTFTVNGFLVTLKEVIEVLDFEAHETDMFMFKENLKNLVNKVFQNNPFEGLYEVCGHSLMDTYMALVGILEMLEGSD